MSEEPRHTGEDAFPTQPSALGSGFVANTLVHTKDGLVPIERIKVGDCVLSRPENGSERTYKRVVKTYSAQEQEVYYLDFFTRDSCADEDTDRVVVTGSHPIWVRGIGWTRVERLHQQGAHKVELCDGRSVAVRFVAPVYRTKTDGLGWFQLLNEDFGAHVDLRGGPVWPDPSPDPVVNNDVEWIDGDGRLTCTVYNFEVEDFGAYYVGDGGVWVQSIRTAGPNNAR